MDDGIAEIEKTPIAAILRHVHLEDFVSGPVLLCLTTASEELDCFEQMFRQPMPAVGYAFDETFVERFKKSIDQNSAIHDGAIVLRRTSPSKPYRVTGFSHRLIARMDPGLEPTANRGSAYNSCLATSAYEAVDGVYLMSRSWIHHFVGGVEVATVQL